MSCTQRERSTDQKTVPLPSNDTTYGYLIDIHQNESGYVHSISTSIYTGLAISEGELTEYDPYELFFGYDSTVVSIGNLYVVPKRVGVTKLYLRNPDNINLIADSINISVSQENNKYVLHTQRTP
jgi:hypothetical protein